MLYFCHCIIVSISVGPTDLSISGPGSASPGESVSVRCESGPSVPPAQISWIVSQSARPIQSEETIHSTDQGTFATVSRMNVTVPGGSWVEDIVVQCVATHLTLGEASLEAVHVIQVVSTSTASTSSKATTAGVTTRQEGKEGGVEETTGAIQHLDYYESYDNQEYHYSEATDNENKPELAVDTTTVTGEDMNAYNKYNVESKAEEKVDHVLLQTDNASEEEEEEDAVMSGQPSAAVGSSHQGEEDLEIPTKSEPTDKSSYSSQRDNTISMTETPQKTESAPMKASPIVKSSSANIRYSILFLVLPIFILSQI